MSKVKDLTVGNPLKLILVFAIPLFIGNVFQEIYSLVDMAVVGYALGDSSIAAIGATSSIYSFILDIAWGLNAGYMIVIARLFGAKDRENLKKALATMITLNLALTIALTAISLLCLRHFMQLLSVPEAIFDEAYGYIFIILAGMTASMLYNMCAGMLRAFGNSLTPLYFLIVSSLLNLGGDFAFVMGFGMGVSGAALSTVIAQSLSAILAIIYILKRYREYLPERRHFNLEKGLVREMTGLGASMAAMYCIVDVGSIIFQRSINSLGEVYITSQASSRKLIEMGMMPLESLSSANSTFVSQNYGAKRFARIRQSVKSITILDVIYGASLFLIFFFLGGQIVSLMTNTDSGQVIANATLSMNIHFACYPALGILLELRTTMQALKHKVVPICSSGIELVGKILFGFIFIPLFGYISVCLAEPIIWVAMALFLGISFLIIKPIKQAEGESGLARGQEALG